MNFQEISVTQFFKYVRYVGPNGKHCVISELQIFGYENIKEENGEEKLFYQPTELPLIVINTENSVEPYDKENEIKSNIFIIKDRKIYKNTTGGVRVRFNGTLGQPKKPYRIKFDSKQNLFDFPAKAKKWTSIANYIDKTLIRNTLALKISQIFSMKYTLSCRHVDVILNGEYKGNYILCDQIEVSKDRVELTEMKKSSTEEPEITGGYFLEGDAYALQEKSHFTSNMGALVTIKYPDEDDINEIQKNWIKSYFNEVEKKISSRTHNVENIDKESFVKFFLINEFCGDPDFTWSSLYMFKERNDNKLYFGPIWDYDIAFDNDLMLYPTNNKTNFTFVYLSGRSFNPFVLNIIKNESIVSLLKAEWKEITENGTLTKDTLISFIDDKVNEIQNSQKLNFIRWDILNKTVVRNPVITGNYTEEVNNLKKYIINRFDSLTKIIEKTTPVVEPEIESFLVEKIQESSSANFIDSYLSIRIKYFIWFTLLFLNF